MQEVGLIFLHHQASLRLAEKCGEASLNWLGWDKIGSV